ncbi:MAG: pyridoxal phosphate-dependent aminotransferase, partial [Spirochaetales bacterium]
AAAAMNIALKTILEPGDKVIAVKPYFMEYNSYAANHGGRIEAADCDDTFNPDLGSLEKLLDRSTAAIILNSPNNPSGAVYSAETLRRLADLLGRKSAELGRRIYIVSDEPYRKIVYDGLRVPSVMEAYPHTLVCSSYSKELSIPGERIGWLAVSPRAEDCENLINGCILCNRISGYVNAPALMQRVVGRLQGESVDISLYREKRGKICAILERAGYEFMKPAGTFYVFPKAPGGDDVAFVKALQEERILTVPGSGFGLPGYFRIAFCVEDRVIENSAEGFARVREKFRKP